MTFTERVRASSQRPNGKVARLIQLAKEMTKFGAVGGIAFLVNMGIFNFLLAGPGHLLEGKATTARIIASVIATFVSWIGNRLWAFREKRSKEPVKELIVFAVVNVIGIGIEAVPVYITQNWMHHYSLVALNAAAVVGTVFGTIFRYLCYRLVIFNPNNNLAGKSLSAETGPEASAETSTEK